VRTLLFSSVIGIFFLLYTLISYYIGLRGWHYLFQYIPQLNRTLYWWFFWSVALSYLAARLVGHFLPDALRYGLTLLGAYWLAAMFYSFQIILIFDLIRLLDKWLKFIPDGWKTAPRFTPAVGAVVLFLVAGILVYGTWNARNPRLQHYDISIPKSAGSLDRLHMVLVSDIHLGEINHNGRLLRMVEMIESLQPDIVLLPGDVIDEDIGPFVKQDMTSTFRRINPKYGIYAVPGNHEYIRGHINETVHYLEQAGIVVLRDNYVIVGDSFCIAGSDDNSHAHFDGNEETMPLSMVLEGIDRSLPVILLSHQPNRLEEAMEQGVDLQLSGHTHRGQLFPLNLITGRIFETDWGYLQKGSLQLIVSSGFGTWGPPIRIGNRPEIVEIMITFNKKGL